MCLGTMVAPERQGSFSENQKYTHMKKILEKYRIKKLLFIIKKTKWMKIDFTYRRNFP